MIGELLYQCKVTNGLLEITHRKKMAEDIRTQCPDGSYELILRKKKKTVSNQLRRYYFGVVVKLVKEGLKDAGMRVNLQETDQWIKDILAKLDTKTVHEYLKDLFIDKIIIDESTGEIIQNEISTKRMTNTQFMDYYAPVYEWGKTFLGIDIPEPNENFDLPEQYKTFDDGE